MRLISLFIFVLISSTAFCQANEASYPDFSGKTLSEVDQTKGWIVIEKTMGYLNSDQIKDVAVILQSGNHRFKSCNESAELLEDEERIILVLTSENGVKQVTTQNNKFIARPDDGGMACYLKPNLSVNNRQLNISYQYTRSSMQYNFEYKNRDMILVSARSSGVSGGKSESDYFDFKKGIIKSKEGRIGSDSTRKKTIPIEFDGFKKLSEFGEMYDLKVAENKYL